MKKTHNSFEFHLNDHIIVYFHNFAVCVHFQSFQYLQKIFLVMELCEKGELSKFLESRGTLSESETRLVMHRLISAISYLHRLGQFIYNILFIKSSRISKTSDHFITVLHYCFCSCLDVIFSCIVLFRFGSPGFETGQHLAE